MSGAKRKIELWQQGDNYAPQNTPFRIVIYLCMQGDSIEAGECRGLYIIAHTRFIFDYQK